MGLILFVPQKGCEQYPSGQSYKVPQAGHKVFRLAPDEITAAAKLYEKSRG